MCVYVLAVICFLSLVLVFLLTVLLVEQHQREAKFCELEPETYWCEQKFFERTMKSSSYYEE